MPKRKSRRMSERDREMLAIQGRPMRLFHKANRYLQQAESEIVRFMEKWRARGDRAMYEHGLATLVSFYEIAGAGRNRRTEDALAAWEALSPSKLEPRLARARHFGVHLDDPVSALRILRSLRRPKRPRRGDADWYEILWGRGLMELRARQKRAAVRTMRELADHTEKHWRDKWIFFFDLYFVREMIEAKLALRDCQRYLKAISQRDQVSHDAKETARLLAVLASNKQSLS